MKFTYRDLLWLTVMVAVALVWSMDRAAARRERFEAESHFAMRESELASRAKMWEAEANRAEKRNLAARDALERLWKENIATFMQ